MKKLQFLAVLAVVFSPGLAHAAAPMYGDTVTNNVKLRADLDCSAVSAPFDALTIGADNLTINLGGYEIIGPNFDPNTACPATSAGGDGDGTKGIVVEGYDNINILNGAVQGFERGIRVKNAEMIRISNIEAYDNAFSAVRIRENAHVDINNSNFHDNRNDHIGVSAGGHLSLMNTKLVDGCASGTFVFPPNTGLSLPGGHADIKHSSFVDNLRSAVNFWGATGSVEHSLISGNDANTLNSFSSDFGQISLTNLEGGDISIRCNDIRDSDDANNKIERGIGFRGSIAATAVEVTKNLFVNNPVAIHFSTDGTLVTVDIHKNTFDDTNTTDFEFVNNTWTVDADKNFYVRSSGPVIVNTGPSILDTDPVLNKAQHCRGAVGVQ